MQTVGQPVEVTKDIVDHERADESSVYPRLSEKDIGELKLGDKASISVTSFPNHPFTGEVTQIRPSQQKIQNVATYDVVISAPNPDLLLKPGMTATIRILVDRRDDVLRAPNQALRYSPRELTVTNGAGNPRTSPDGASRLWILRHGKPSEITIQLGLDAAATLIVLPLMPDQAMGPFSALNPHSIWIIVILVMAIGAFGHIAVRLLGARFGLPIAGLASGFISSTATIGVMGARAVKAPYLLGPATAGAVLSTVATVIQLVLLLAATNMATLRALLVPFACAGAAALAYGSVFTIRALRDSSGEVDERGRAFSLKTAFLFAAMLSGVLLASTALNEWFGATGLVVAAAVAGFVDTHSAAISVATLVGAGKMTATDAALPILIALSTNTITKVVICIFAGGAGFVLRVIPGLVLVILAAWGGTVLARVLSF
jgi:uncharacterized membrane protein (DUF4010 family)